MLYLTLAILSITVGGGTSHNPLGQLLAGVGPHPGTESGYRINCARSEFSRRACTPRKWGTFPIAHGVQARRLNHTVLVCRTARGVAMGKLRRLLLAAMLIGVVAWPAPAAEENKEDRAELRIAQRQLRSPDETQRIEGIQRLGAMPGAEAAKIIVPAGLVDSAPAVRRAAYHALLAWKDDPQVGAFLLGVLKRESRAKRKGPSCVVPLVMVLLASEPADTQGDLTKFLDAFAAAPENVALLIDAADELGKLADAVSLVSLRRMTELKCFSSVFGFRRAVVQAMISVRLPKAMEALIDLLPKTDGEVRGDIRRYLVAVAGQIAVADDKAWSSWWKKHKEDFRFPPRDAKPLSAEAVPGTPSYYGLSIQARRIVFVIDISGSMRGPRLEAAQRELMRRSTSCPTRLR